MEEDDSTPAKSICPDVDHEEVVKMSDCGWRQWRSLVELGMSFIYDQNISGKIENFSTRSKSCRTCTLSLYSKSTPPPHDCSINWNRTTKAMESDMIEEMVKDVNDGSVCIKTIVGDEDSTIISKLRTNIVTNIGKTLDANRVKEILRNHLYFVKK